LLPPNARRIKKARDAGQHPRIVRLAFARRWCAGHYPDDTVIVLADEFARGAYTWGWLAGVPALLVNHDASWAEFGAFAAAVGASTAPVFIDGVDGGVVEVDYLMYAMRWPRPGHAWPDCWSDAQERAYAQRRDRWEFIQRERAHAQA
jgi:hypothetical protein